MDFEASTSSESSSLSGSPESGKEVSEKQKESYKKAQAQIQKSKKDESKAKGDNTSLFGILTRFIQNPYYEEYVPIVTNLLQNEVPARYILAFISLVYPEAALHILESLGQKEDIKILLALHKYEHMRDLVENDLHPSIREWMSTWSNISKIYVTSDESSLVMRNKLLNLLENKSEEIFLESETFSLTFFFLSRHIRIEQKKARSYASFIMKELISVLRKSVQSGDNDLLLST